jgi:hypothetical protein
MAKKNFTSGNHVIEMHGFAVKRSWHLVRRCRSSRVLAWYLAQWELLRLSEQSPVVYDPESVTGRRSVDVIA